MVSGEGLLDNAALGTSGKPAVEKGAARSREVAHLRRRPLLQVTLYQVWKGHLLLAEDQTRGEAILKAHWDAVPVNMLVHLLTCQDIRICPPKYNHQQS